jgi:hypothetical protein
MSMSPALIAVTMLAATLVADRSDIQIGPPQPLVTPDTIRADREKFEREYKLNTKRPWDGTQPGRPNAPEPPLQQKPSG